jgi:hypothetical protein
MVLAEALAAAVARVMLARRAGRVGDLALIGAPVIASVAWATAAVSLVALLSTLAAGATGVIIVAPAVVIAPRRPFAAPAPAPTSAMIVASVNFLYSNHFIEEAVAAVIKQGTDVLIGTEVTHAADRLLAAQFPYRLVSDRLAQDDLIGVTVSCEVCSRCAPTTSPCRVAGESPTAVRSRCLARITAGCGRW